MERRSAMTASLEVCCVFFLLISWANAQQKNVLMLIADDLRPNVGAYEDANEPFFTSPTMITPNIDALASKSLVFTRAYSQVAMCGPSRNSFLTGRRADTTRCYVNGDNFRNLGPNNETSPIVTIPQFFMENGYYSVGAGKVFNPGQWDPFGIYNLFDDYPLSWTEPMFHTPNTDDLTVSWRAFSREEMENNTLRDVTHADYAINKLQELAPNALLGIQPFFLGFGVHKPHLPWDFPEEFLDYYPKDDIDLPANPYIPSDMPDSAWTVPNLLLGYPDASANGTGIENIGQPNVTYSDSKIKELRRAYYAASSFADQQIGRVIQELNSLGLAESTIIVFFGDHGMQLGEHSEWEKLTNFEIANRVPLMLHIPGEIDTHIESNKLVELVDIFPTLVEAAGFDPISKCPTYSRDVALCREGSSLLGVVTNPKEWKTAIFYQKPLRQGLILDQGNSSQSYSVMTEQYRYTEYVSLNNVDEEAQAPNWSDPIDFGELYDLVNDPMENINLIHEEGYENIIEDLQKVLHEGWYQHN